MALAGAGGFLAGVLLIAILGGAQPVYKERTLTVARPPQGSAVPALVGQPLDVALDKLESPRPEGRRPGRRALRHRRRARLEGRPPGSLARRAPRPGRHRAPRRRPGMTRALLLDLDDTLIVEEPAAVAAFAATARVAAERHPLDPARAGARRPRAGARDLARGAPPRVLPAHRHQLVGGRCSAATRATATSCARCARGRPGTAARPGDARWPTRASRTTSWPRSSASASAPIAARCTRRSPTRPPPSTPSAPTTRWRS